ncbi:iron ABC transporter permease [Zobellella endophytica]|uniref:Iron ABC transporter permease n=1 Tax=Zobellella endophytica TaxID=2116700 RepID=A0A2P7R8U8_9GAMM|nr:iron ABC transporter permease [Zobellella endophytica]PSJ46613.1 iron ABC transporter permease [Zobellella endophytica]
MKRLGWMVSSWGIALLLTLPILALIYEALLPAEDIFRHLWNTVLPVYINNTFWLVLLVLGFSLLCGLPAAWLMAMCELPGKRWLQWALILPLAMPSYIVAFVYTDLLDFSGPVQSTLRAWFGWQSSADYVFPPIRSLGGAALVLGLVLYPYVYLLARTAFLEQSTSLIQSSRLLGCTPWQSFKRVSLPLARPSIAVGLSLVAMETLADFGTVKFFAVNTLTTAVYDTWLGYGSLNAAAKISAIMLLVVMLLLSLERMSRKRQQVFQKGMEHEQETGYRLTGLTRLGALVFCWGLVVLGFLMPFLILCYHALRYFGQAWNARFFEYSLNSLLLSTLVAAVALMMALLLGMTHRLKGKSHTVLPLRLASMGYALPGTVLAIGVLVPLTSLDFAINDLALWLGFTEPGLVLTGTMTAIAFGYLVRFGAMAVGAVESSINKVSPSLDMVTQTMGYGPRAMIIRVHMPLIRKGMLAGALLVFIECMKELPAALLLRPFNFQTLATYVYQFVSDEQLEVGALPAIVIVLVGLIPLIFLNRSLEQHH